MRGTELMMKLTGNNMGALEALTVLAHNASLIDMEVQIGASAYYLWLDTLSIYGTDLYVLYSDICKKDIAKMMAVIKATILRIFDKEILQDVCSRQDFSGKDLVPVQELYDQIKVKYPTFDSFKDFEVE